MYSLKHRARLQANMIHVFWLLLTYDLMKDRHIDDFPINNFFFHIKQRDSMLPRVWTVIDRRIRKHVPSKSVTRSAAPRAPLLCSYHILTSSVFYYRTESRQHGFYLLNRSQGFLTEALSFIGVSAFNFSMTLTSSKILPVLLETSWWYEPE